MFVSFRNSIDSMPSSVKPVFAILVTIATAGLLFFVGFRVELLLYKVDLNDFSGLIHDVNNPHFVGALRMFMVLQTIVLFAVPPFVLAWIYKKNSFSLYFLNTKPPLFYLLLSICIIILSNPLVNLLVELNGTIADDILGAVNSLKSQDLETQKLVESLLKDTSLGALCINSVIVAFLPAAFEELFFRGFLQKVVLRKYMNIHLAILCTAFLFSFFHFQFYGFIPRFLLGLMFGYLFEWSGSLWITICMHFINNFMAVFGNYLVNRHIINDSIDSIGAGSLQWVGVVSAMVVFLLFVVMFRKYQSLHSNKSRQTGNFV